MDGQRLEIDLDNLEIDFGGESFELEGTKLTKKIKDVEAGSKLDFETITDKLSSTEEDHLLNLNEYYKNMSLKKINHVNINEEDYKLHMKSIQTIKNSIWEKIKN